MVWDDLAFTPVNHARILAVESSFGQRGAPLCEPGRVLVGEGRLSKLCRRRIQPKVFFLFSDVLVYGSIIVAGRCYTNQKIISLEHIQLEDVEDGTRMENHWLIRTPRKSFYVAAGCPEEKRAWMERIAECRDRRLRRGPASPAPPAVAPAWVPDKESALCMRCSVRFTVTHRRHHCRGCGLLVCAECSKERAVLDHIHHSHPQRVCRRCHAGLLLKGQRRPGGGANNRPGGGRQGGEPGGEWL